MMKRRLTMVLMCIFSVLCLFAVQSDAADANELTSGPLSYIVSDDGSVTITKYSGTAKSYTIPSEIGGKPVRVIGRYAFMYTEKLEKLVIPGSVKEIDSGIHGCYDLKTIIINDGKLKTIDNVDIENCYALENLIVPKNVKSIGTLIGCTALKEIRVNEKNPYICSDDGVVFSKDKTVLIKYPQGKLVEKYVVPSSVKTIAGFSFYEARQAKIFIPESVETIEETAFAYSKSEIYTDASRAPKKWKNAFTGRTVHYNQINESVETVEDISCTQTTTTITLKWDKVEQAAGYRIYKYDSKTKKYVKVKTINSAKTNKYKITELKAGTVYKFKVRAFKKVGKKTIWGDYSKVFETATKCKTPSIKKLTTSKKKASFTWSDVSGETGYQVYYSSKKDSGYKKVKSYKANVVKGSKSKLKSGKTYYFKVRAYKKTDSGTVYSGWSKVKSIKIK